MKVLRYPAAAVHRTVDFNDLSSPLEFETDLFVGRALVLVRGLPSTPAGPFDGRKRRSWMIVQGRFKRAVSCDALVTGVDFARPLRLPGKVLLGRIVQWVVGKLGGAVHMQLTGRRPHFHAPIISAAQVRGVFVFGLGRRTRGRPTHNHQHPLTHQTHKKRRST